MSDYLVSLIRTFVPALIGSIAAWLLNAGVDLPADWPAAAAPVAVALVIGVYYAAARWLEGRFPWLGWLLGAPKQPSYPDA